MIEFDGADFYEEIEARIEEYKYFDAVNTEQHNQWHVVNHFFG